MGYSGDSFAAKMQENAVREAATAGIQSVEEVIKLLKQTSDWRNAQSHDSETRDVIENLNSCVRRV